ncbi:MAG: four helix bundle protein [Chloroflexota bacterium]
MTINYASDIYIWHEWMDFVEEVYELPQSSLLEQFYRRNEQIRPTAASLPEDTARVCTHKQLDDYLNHRVITEQSLTDLQHQLKTVQRFGEVTQKVSHVLLEHTADSSKRLTLFRHALSKRSHYA